MATLTPIAPQADSRPAHADLGVLRFLTCGSVDDGKSTLIGRLLYDSKAILADALQAIERSSRKRGHAAVDLSLLTDGLQAEREQGITIDVAYRYFSTGTRSFIIADAPGHEQYTSNMVTAASTADLALILVDARKGVLTQTRRHLTLAHLVGIRHLVVVVNKMDLVGFDEAVFERIRAEVLAFSRELGVADLSFLPLSALAGDMVVDRGEHLPWYAGPTLIELLEAAALVDGRQDLPFRFLVQWVIRPHQDFRGYAGRVASGRVKVGDALSVLPSGRSSRVKAIHLGDRQLSEAVAGQSITLELADDLDISRGDLLAEAARPPVSARTLDADLCWLSEAPSRPGGRYLLRHGSRETRAILHGTAQRLDLNSLQREPEERLAMNDIARLHLKLQQPLPSDAYLENRATGAFILVDESTHATVAAGFIRAAE